MSAPDRLGPEPTRTRRGALARVGLRLLGFAAAAAILGGGLSGLSAPPPEAAAAFQVGDDHGRMDGALRRRIFGRLAGQWQAHRRKARALFPQDAWSQQDHTSRLFALTVATLAARYRRHPSELYWLWDDGLRAGWPGPDGQPLRPAVVPLDPRRH